MLGKCSTSKLYFQPPFFSFLDFNNFKMLLFFLKPGLNLLSPLSQAPDYLATYTMIYVSLCYTYHKA